jgi:hypothetical protein
VNQYPYCYLFVRTDISLAQQIVQTNHATFMMAYALPQGVEEVNPSLVLVGVPNKKSLERVLRKLKMNRIDASAFFESDEDMGLSAIATVPLNEEQRALLQDYSLWRYNDVSRACSSVVRASTSQEDEGRMFDPFHAPQGQVA